nr:hypothetical protein [Marinicella sp. W31]MDC2880282.1 hypothetical protein [Marinicella sp. W31]
MESEVLNMPEIRECAAVAVPSEFTEDEVMIIVSPAGTQSIDPASVIDRLSAALPRYMVPRYLRVLDDLPKTASGKVQKHLLRKDGITASTWDREAAKPVRAQA